MKNILSFENITKTFNNGAIIANNNLSLTFKEGEIHSIIGENGSGKTTLMSILFGLYKPDSGKIFYDSNEVSIHKNELVKKNIGMVHQHLSLIDHFTVLDNLVLGQEEGMKKWGILFKKQIWKHFEKISHKYHIKLDPKKYIFELSIGQKQKVEILKALWQEKKIIILDEPTSTLSIDEIDDLMNIINQLKKEGKTIIFISHKMAEVKKISDRITILKKGKLIGTFENTEKLTASKIAEMMIGVDVKLKYPSRKPKNNIILKVKNLNYFSFEGKQLLKNVSFEVREGEIFGLAGIQSNGQEEILEIISGLAKPESGEVWFEDQNIIKKPVRYRNLLMSHVPAEREKYGIAINKDLDFNSLITRLDSDILFDKNLRYKNFEFISIENKTNIENWTKKIINEFHVHGGDQTNTLIKNLSGGNQQKFLVGREVLNNKKLLLVGHPTRGVDIKTVDMIYKKIISQVKNKSVLLYSLELSELVAVCDRIAIIYNGQIVDIVDPKKTDVKKISKLMVGIKK